MELHQLQAFVTVAQERNFSRAARLLHIAQPALSRKIKHLEDELNVQLISRSTNPIALTEPGHRFLLDARRILLLCSRSADTARRFRQRSQSTLRVGYITFLHHHLVSRAAELYRRIHPDIAVSILDVPCGRQLIALEEGSVDVGFIVMQQQSCASARFAAHIICHHDMVVALPACNGLAAKQYLTEHELHRLPTASISSPTPDDSHNRNAGLCVAGFGATSIGAHHENPITILDWVATGLGAAVLPQEAALLPHDDDVVFRPLVPPIRCFSLIVWRRGEADRTVMDFINIAKEAALNGDRVCRHLQEAQRSE